MNFCTKNNKDLTTDDYEELDKEYQNPWREIGLIEWNDESGETRIRLNDDDLDVLSRADLINDLYSFVFERLKDSNEEFKDWFTRAKSKKIRDKLLKPPGDYDD